MIKVLGKTRVSNSCFWFDVVLLSASYVFIEMFLHLCKDGVMCHELRISSILCNELGSFISLRV